MPFTRFGFKKNWNNADDFTTIENDEAQVRADMQALHDEAKEGLNKLMGELEAPAAANALGAVDNNGEESTVQKELDSLSTRLKEAVEVKAKDLGANNIALDKKGETTLAEQYGLTSLVPKVYEALKKLGPIGKDATELAKLAPKADYLTDPETFLSENTSKRLPVVGDDLKPDDAMLALAQIQLDSFTGGLLITATYASTGKPAKSVYFTGLPDADPELCKTDETGEFFVELPPGEYTLSFAQMIGQMPLESRQVVVERRKVTRLDLIIEKSTGLATFATSGDYVVGEDAATMKLCAVGGGGSGSLFVWTYDGTTDYYITALSGGGGGFVVERTTDLTSYRGKRLSIIVGAGGPSTAQGVVSFEKGFSGTRGGDTTIVVDGGDELLRAAGGDGGVCEFVRYYDSTTPESVTATATSGQGKGVGAKLIVGEKHTNDSGGTYWDAHVEFDDEGVSGMHPFGLTEVPLVSLGGRAAAYTRNPKLKPSPIQEHSAAGVQPETEQGVGFGGASTTARSRETDGTMPGSPGAVFIMYAEV